MAYTDNDTPEEVFGVGYSSDGSSISLTIESSGLLPEISSAEANASTGDYRKVLYGLVEGIFQKYTDIPQTDLPTKMELKRGTTENLAGEIARTYTFKFILDSTGFEVSAE